MDERGLEFWCPKCGALVVPPSEAALALIKAAGVCHVCRLAHTVDHLVETGQLEVLDNVLEFTEGYEGFRFTLASLGTL